MSGVLSGIYHVVLHASIMGLFCLWIGWQRSVVDAMPPGRRILIWGAGFAVLAILALLQPTEALPGLRIDIRATMIALSTLFGGPAAGFLTAVAAALTRLAVGGPVATTGLVSIGLCYLAAVAVLMTMRRREGRRRIFQLLLLGGLVGIAGPAASFVTNDWSTALTLIGAGALPQIIAVTLTVPIFAIIIIETDRSRRSQEDLRTHERELRAANTKLSELAAQLERRNGEYMAALERAEAFGRAKSQFMANISHELRTPLNAVIGFSDLLLMQGPAEPSGTTREYVQMIRASGERLLEIINDVLTAARIDGAGFEAELREFSLAALLQEVTGFLEPAVNEKRQRIERKLDDGLMIHGDAKLLRQALIHVLGNASKFGPRDSLIEIQAIAAADMVELTILDQGPGIEAETSEAAFRPFWQRDASDTREHGGLGLGLTIARHFVEMQGGKIEISRRATGGTCVRIRLHRGAAALAA
ncbi:hypothetical protein FRZ61_20190 [Hypericibacter adhaerens]|jgi:signal transduction histidine kinase|uniref:histidine kinase n=1 Tax=Hypericibacter adhaerens TaxID=2602016 RepID=A0A5J6N0E9_9PROT|nr:sensor histidine kinase [Hypericibacter adhaerens]QEX22090.1 hypothetical protein FRZ61_20190 [Hypericibacter adhaerens]